jgi:prefoldin subunit 5
MSQSDLDSLNARCDRIQRILEALQRKLATQSYEELERAEAELQRAMERPIAKPVDSPPVNVAT